MIGTSAEIITDVRLSSWVARLFKALARQGDNLLPFDLLESLVACGAPDVESWVARTPVALSRSLLWAAIADKRRRGGQGPELVAAAIERAVEAAVASYHPLPAIDLVRRWGAAAVPGARAHLERFALRPGEWFFGAHAVLADALATADPQAAERHLEVALGPRPSLRLPHVKYASALEAVVLAAALARCLEARGRTEEAEEQRAAAIDRFARGLGSGGFEDRPAHFDLEEEEGIDDRVAVCGAVFDLVLGALPPGTDVSALRVAGVGRLAGVLTAAGRLDEARALAGDEAGIDGTIVWAAITVAAPGHAEAAAAFAQLPPSGVPAAVMEAYAEGLLTEGERSAMLCAVACAYARLGRAREGLDAIGPLLDETREAWGMGLRHVREPLAAAVRGAVVAPSSIFDPVTKGALERGRKRKESLRAPRLLAAAASRPGEEGAALLAEALACCADTDLEGREQSFPENWLGAYAVHGRFDDARRVANQMYGHLGYSLHISIEGIAALVLALDAGGRPDEAARELERWLDVPPQAQLLPAVLAVAARRGTLGQLAAEAAAALREIDARVGDFRIREV